MLPQICSHRIQKVNGRCPKCYAERMKNYADNLNRHHRRVLPRAARIRERRIEQFLRINRQERNWRRGEISNVRNLPTLHYRNVHFREPEIQRIINDLPLPPIRQNPVDWLRMQR